jgi:(E)-4-hydroxy-3-methyl-but-2-enyl pyrophosphate reductase
MKIKVAKTAGFCMGVRRAVNMVLDRVHADAGSIYCLGPLIHNPQVVEFLKAQGVRDLSGLDDIQSGTVVIPSHGIRPEVREGLAHKGVSFCDATCPRVARVHGLIKKYQAQGFLVLILGDPGHAEVEALLGEAKGDALVIQGPDQVSELPDADKVLLVAQTTQSQKFFQAVVEAVKKRYAGLDKANLGIENTICDSTRRRQDEVRKMAAEVEAMVVVGGKASANTRRLAEISRDQGVVSFLVENEKELNWEELKNFRAMGLTAGASTPNWVIRRVYEELSRRNWEERMRPLRWLYLSLRSLVVSNVYISAGAASLCLCSGFLQGYLPRYRNLIISFLYVFAMHTFNILVNREAVSLNEPMRSRAFDQQRRLWISLSLIALALAFGLCISIGLWSFIIFSLVSIPGLFYQVRILRGFRTELLPYHSLAEIPGSKDIFSALGWAVVCALMPLLDHPDSIPLLQKLTSGTAAAFILVLGLVFLRSVIQDFRDLQGDRMVGRETLPIALGERRTRALLIAVAGVLVMTLGLLYLFGQVPVLALWMLLPVAYAGLTIMWFTRRTIVQGLRAESLVDFTFILAGLVAILDKVL